MKSTLLAIDPSIRSCGWAFFRTNHLVSSGTLKERGGYKDASIKLTLKLLDHVREETPHLTRLIIEMPCYQGSMRGKVSMKQGHITHLAFLVGMLVGTLPHCKLLLPEPSVWKGQLPKSVTQHRLHSEGFIFHSSDEADAIALGLWGLKQMI